MKSLKFVALLVLAAGLGTRPVAAQQVVKKVVLDSVQTAVQKTLYALRDSLQLVDAATSRLVRDRLSSSDAVRQARARLIAERCSAVDRMSVVARDAIVGAGRPSPDKGKVLPALERSLTELKRQMGSCATEFQGFAAGAKADELRDYGVSRGRKVQQAIRQYEPAVQAYFATVMGDRYTPNLLGAGETPTSR